MSLPYGFDEASVRRIARAVKQVEGPPGVNARGNPNHVPPQYAGAARYFRLTQVGGVAGTNNATCSFTYNVFAFSDTGKTVAIATSVALTGNTRLPNVTYTSASYGGGVVTGVPNGTNNPSGVVLLWVDELAVPEDCE